MGNGQSQLNTPPPEQVARIGGAAINSPSGVTRIYYQGVDGSVRELEGQNGSYRMLNPATPVIPAGQVYNGASALAAVTWGDNFANVGPDVGYVIRVLTRILY